MTGGFVSPIKKVVIIVVIVVLAIALIVGLTPYAKNGLNKTMGKQLNALFNTPGRLTKTFDNTDSRYTINYPVDWIYDKTTPGTVIFSGNENSSSSFSSVNIQVILTKKMKGEYATVDEFIQDIKSQVKKQSPDATFLSQDPIEVTEKDGSIAKGQSLIFTYSYNGHTVKQWQVVVLRADHQVFYACGYTSTVEQYEVDLPIAKAMFSSWVIY
jgi:hypothetical protein